MTTTTIVSCRRSKSDWNPRSPPMDQAARGEPAELPMAARRRPAGRRAGPVPRKSGQRTSVTHNSAVRDLPEQEVAHPQLARRADQEVRVGHACCGKIRCKGRLVHLLGIEPAVADILRDHAGGVGDLGTAAVVDRQAEGHARSFSSVISTVSVELVGAPRREARRGGRSWSGGRSAASVRSRSTTRKWRSSRIRNFSSRGGASSSRPTGSRASVVPGRAGTPPRRPPGRYGCPADGRAPGAARATGPSRPLPSMMIATCRGSCSGRRPSRASCSRPSGEIRPDGSPSSRRGRGGDRGITSPRYRRASAGWSCCDPPCLRPGFRRPRPGESPGGRDRRRRSSRHADLPGQEPNVTPAASREGRARTGRR